MLRKIFVENVWIFKLNKLKIKSIKLDLFATYSQSEFNLTKTITLNGKKIH